MKTFFYSLASIILLIGCNTTAKNETIYFGGQIKNPKDNIVTLHKDDLKIKTVKLDNNHKFLFKLDSINSGLYTFKHGKEFQYVYLAQKDSLLIRLNTWDFDGSLVFSGKGANRNNLLIQLFLENEQENKQFYNFFKLNENDFLAKVDSLIHLKETQFKIFKENAPKQTDNFNNLIKSVIYFPIYANKEEYPLHYKKYFNNEKLPQLTTSFYNHRDILNNQPFQGYYAYKKFLWSKIYNQAFYQIEQDTPSGLSATLLKKISNLKTDENTKNSMLQKAFINSLFDGSCSDIDKEKTELLFFQNCNDTIKNAEVSKILKIVNTLKKDTKLPEFYIKTTQGKTINSSSLIGENMVIYFWPKELNRIQNMAKRVNFLVKKYSNIRFVGIDGQSNKHNWRAYVEANKLDLSSQFQFVEHNKNIFYTNEFPRAIIINKDGLIQNNFTFISHGNFEQLLQSLKK